jgi:hypothetical protein
VLVNEAFARRFFSGASAVGSSFAGITNIPKTIVGIVGDAVYYSVREDIPPTIYAPLA